MADSAEERNAGVHDDPRHRRLAPWVRQWRDLEALGGASSPYRTLSWVSAWLEQYAPNAPLLVVDLSDQGTLAALSTREMAGTRVLEPVGTGISDYPGPVSTASEGECWRGIAASLADRRDEWDLLHLDAVVDLEAVLSSLGTELGVTPRWRAYEECPRIDTREPFDALLARRGRNQRKAVKRIDRRVAELGPLSIESAKPPFDVHEIQSLAEVERASWKWDRGDATFRNARQAGFLSALLGDPEAPVRLWRLRVGGQLAAFAVVLEGARVWHFYLATYREDHPHTGAYLLNRIIEAACTDDGCDYLDLLRGRFDYKEAWMDEVRVLYEVVCSNGLRGALLAQAFRIRWALARDERLQRWRSRILRVGDRRR